MRIGVYSLLALVAAAFSSAQTFPPGWRKPSGNHISAEWRKKSPTRFLTADGDFDGDGKLDFAQLLISTASMRCALFVRLSTENHDWGEPIWRSDRPGCEHFGIQIARPGKRETLCSSDPSSCGPNDPVSLTLTTDGIVFVSQGTASTIAYWDKAVKKFRWAPLSD
jgi:hypothetical protein